MSLTERLQLAILPGRCLLCDTPSERAIDLCTPCEQDLPWLLSACERCALPLPNADRFCIDCLTRLPPFERTFSAFHYAWPISGMIGDFKTNGDLTTGRILAELICRSQPRPMVDLIIPVPLHPKAQRKRGFNQATEVAARLSQYWAIPFDSRNCERVQNTAMQKQLNRATRLRNLQGAFAVRSDLNADRILIVDNVVTTSATVTEISRLLLTRGARAISVMCIARTAK